MSSRLRPWSLIFCAALGTACGSDGVTESPAEAVPLGLWILNYSLANAEAATSCIGGGQVSIYRNESSLAGSSLSYSLRCASPQDTTLVYRPVTFEPVTVFGASIEFSDDRGCQYAGTITATPQRLAGTLTCTLIEGGTARLYAGTWSAARPLAD